MAQSETHNTYLSGYKPKATQHHEWRNAENSAGYLLPVLKKKVAETPNLSLLDVGAGSGTITASLAHHMPHGHVTACDLSPSILSKALSHAQSVGATNVSTREASIYALPFEDASYDIVHASQVLAHLDNPISAVREMLRITKNPGGVIAIRESDLRAWSFYPEFEGMWEMNRMLRKVMEGNGAHVDAGTRLVGWVLECGVSREKVRASAGCWCYSSREEREVWGGTMIDRCEEGETRRRALEGGWVSEGDLKKMAEGWRKWVGAEEGWFGCLHGEVLVEL